MESQPLTSVPPLDGLYARIGLGPWHFFSLLAIGTYFVTETMLNNFSYLVTKAVDKHWSLSHAEAFFLLISRDVGIILTGCLLPWLGDKYGRLTVMKWGMLGRFSAIMMAVMALSYHWLLAGFFLMGCFLGPIKAAVSAFSIEILPIKGRGALLIGLFMFVMAGALGSAALAIYLIPQFRPDNWRMLLFICAIPVIIGMLASNLMFFESPRFLAMTGRAEKAIKYLNKITFFNRQLPLSPEEEALVRAQPHIHLSDYSVRDTTQYLLTPKYRPKLYCLLLIWFITGYQYSALMASFPANLSDYTHNPLIPIEIWTLTNAFVVPMPTIEMPSIGRRGTLLGFLIAQIVFSLVATLVSNQLVFMAIVIPYTVAVTFTWRVLYPYTLELFETSVRCYSFGLCYAAGRIGGMLSRLQPVGVHEGSVSVMLALNFVGLLVVLLKFPYETVGMPLEDYSEVDRVRNKIET